MKNVEAFLDAADMEGGYHQTDQCNPSRCPACAKERGGTAMVTREIIDTASRLKHLISQVYHETDVPEALQAEVRAICQSLLDAAGADQMGWGPD